MSSNMSDFFKSNNGQLIMVVVVGLIILGVIIAVGVVLFNKSKENGASVSQMYVGKKIGELCTSDAMCGTNKCRLNVCVV
jgi:hypothetical protein